MSYTKQNWEDRDLGVGVNGTPVNAEHLNHMEDGIAANAEDIAAVNADLTDEHQIRTLTNLSDLGLSSGVSTLDVLQAMRDQGYTNTLMRFANINANTISDTPIGTGVFSLFVASSASQRYGSVEYICNSGSTSPRYFIGHITSGFAGVNWFEVGLTQISTNSLPLPDEEDA